MEGIIITALICITLIIICKSDNRKKCKYVTHTELNELLKSFENK